MCFLRTPKSAILKKILQTTKVSFSRSMRAGAQTMTLLAAPRTCPILWSLSVGPKGQRDLRREAGSPAQSTLRNHLASLKEAGAVKRRRLKSFPGTLEYALTDPGRELLDVAAGIQRWLAAAPPGPLELGTSQAQAAIKGMVDAWLAKMLAPLAQSPLPLTELDKRLANVSYPTIERRLEAMLLSEQIKAHPRSGNGRPYELSPWLRQGVAPLVIAARWECHHQPPGASPITGLEIESALRIASPLLNPLSLPDGICQMAAPDGNLGSRSPGLGILEVRGGEISFEELCPQRKPDAWASGSAVSWFEAIVGGELSGLELSGDDDFARALLADVHASLFAEERETR